MDTTQDRLADSDAPQAKPSNTMASGARKELAPHNSHGRGKGGSRGQRGGRNKRSDMGRAEWR